MCNLHNYFKFDVRLQGCIYRGSRGSLGYPGFWGIIKAEAIKREIFEDFYLWGYPGFRKLNTPLLDVKNLFRKQGCI